MEHLVNKILNRTVLLFASLVLQQLAAVLQCNDPTAQRSYSKAVWRSLLFRLRSLSTVFRTTLQTICYTGGIQRTTYDVITNTRQVFYTTATYHYNTVLLQVVALTRDVSIHLLGVGQTYTRHLTQCGIRFLRGRRVNTYTNATTLRTAVQSRALRLVHQFCSSFSN